MDETPKTKSVQASPAPSFVRMLPGVFRYPLAGRGKYVILGGAVAVTIIGYAGMLHFAVHLLLGFAVTGYLAMYLMEVIDGSAGESDEPPDWPDLREIDDTVRPLLLFVGTIFISFAPAIIYRVGPAISGTFLGKSWWEADASVTAGLLIAGTLYAPMALLSVVMHESLAGASPHKVLVAIIKVLPCYLAALAILAVAGIAAIVIMEYASWLPLVGEAITLYLLLALGRILGLIYRTQAKRLAWFE